MNPIKKIPYGISSDGTMLPHKRLPVGISDFKKLRESDCYYVDKSEFIKEVLDASAEVLLVPRPRRFGKTLNLSMLRYFLEKVEPDHRHLFDGLKICDHACFDRHVGKYPVIWLTFKDMKTTSWESMLQGMKSLIITEIERHYPAIQHARVPGTHLMLKNLESAMEGKAHDRVFEDSLLYLSTLLFHAYQCRPVVLIDEYDTPLHAAYQYGFYDDAVMFMRNFLSGGLKDNPIIEKGVITGILRIAKESIFSGLNNPGVYTILESEFNSFFGFTEQEVIQLLKDYGLYDRYDEVSYWYNGYLFGGKVIYNPWSVLNFVNSKDQNARLYWSNTADITMIERLATRGGKEIRDEIGRLLEGKTIERPVYETIVMRQLDQRDDLIWSFLLFSGYLKPIRHIEDEEWELAVPNNEVKTIYRSLIKTWFSTRVEHNLLKDMIRALETADMHLFERMIRIIVHQILSYHDLSGQPEKVYHALVLGMLVWMSGKYVIRSNRESGFGRFDLMLKPKTEGVRGIIMEFKKVESEKENAHEEVLKDALAQIEKKAYITELQAAGIKDILKIAVAFRGKELWIKHV